MMIVWRVSSNDLGKFRCLISPLSIVLNVDQYAEIEDIVESIGADPFPGFKKERLKRKERRLMIENKKVARKANIQVNSVLDIIELKRHLGMRLK